MVMYCVHLNYDIYDADSNFVGKNHFTEELTQARYDEFVKVYADKLCDTPLYLDHVSPGYYGKYTGWELVDSNDINIFDYR